MKSEGGELVEPGVELVSAVASASGLAGATTATRSPGASARGFLIRSGEPRHFGGNFLVLVAPEHALAAPIGERRGRFRQEPSP